MIKIICKQKIDIDNRVNQLSSVISKNNALYISGAISTGEIFKKWHESIGKNIQSEMEYTQLHYNEVICKNIDKIINFANEIRENEKSIVIEPASLKVADWLQEDYLYYWGQVIEKFVNKIIFLDGWHKSIGCIFEFYIGIKLKLELFNQNFTLINLNKFIPLVINTLKDNKNTYIDIETQKKLLKFFNSLNKVKLNTKLFKPEDHKLKDEILNSISSTYNIAQFISFSPYNLIQRFSRVKGYKPNFIFSTVVDALQVLINNSQEKSINLRTFKPEILKGNPFYYGIKDVTQAFNLIKKLSIDGFYIIANETIDINDGGVSGVCLGDIIEFSPNDTPKCVEQPGVCCLPRNFGINLLNKVYGFYPNLNLDKNIRVEFSIHPKRRGFFNEHTIIWEVEKVNSFNSDINITWPNNFSRHIGDKTFGLLVAEILKADVPKSIVVSRNLAPFCFGKETGFSEKWLRTCPSEKTPGKYPTYFGWKDPFAVLNCKELLNNVPSILSQDSVNAIYSGALVPYKNKLLIEGVKGIGDDFMIGKIAPIKLPLNIKIKIKNVYKMLHSKIGELSFEWVFDGNKIWIVQLSKIKALSNFNEIYPGVVKSYISFPIENGLEALRETVNTIEPNTGIELIGNVGIASHFGDILRNAKVPSKLKLY